MKSFSVLKYNSNSIYLQFCLPLSSTKHLKWTSHSLNYFLALTMWQGVRQHDIDMDHISQLLGSSGKLFWVNGEKKGMKCSRCHLSHGVFVFKTWYFIYFKYNSTCHTPRAWEIPTAECLKYSQYSAYIHWISVLMSCLFSMHSHTYYILMAWTSLHKRLET